MYTHVLQVCHLKYIVEKIEPCPWSFMLTLHSQAPVLKREEVINCCLFRAKTENCKFLSSFKSSLEWMRKLQKTWLQENL